MTPMFYRCACGEKVAPEDGLLMYRYVKADSLVNDIDWTKSDLIIEQVKDFVSVNSFSREEKDGALEDYVSVLWSCKPDRIDRIRDVFSYLKQKRGGFPRIFGFIEININEIFSAINEDELNIELLVHDCNFCCSTFNEKKIYNKSVHFGLWYKETEDADEDEIKIKLLECLRNCLFIAKNIGTKKVQDCRILPDLQKISP